MSHHGTICDAEDSELIVPGVAAADAFAPAALPNAAIIAALSVGVPLALAAFPRAASAQGVAPLLDSLNFALTLEYLEDEFYRTGLSRLPTAFTTAESNAIQQISMHETAHVKFLRIIITDFFSSTPVAKPTFDFTARGTFPDVFTNKATFLAVAQAFEDTGVRAYKGQAGNVASNKAVLQAALQIHSVEARHASQIRRLRGQKGWITNADRGTLPAATQAVYDGEDNTTHAGANAAALGTNFGGVPAVTEAFDEPLSKAQVLAIVAPFLA